jgi:hypothetical protein
MRNELTNEWSKIPEQPSSTAKANNPADPAPTQASTGPAANQMPAHAHAHAHAHAQDLSDSEVRMS